MSSPIERSSDAYPDEDNVRLRGGPFDGELIPRPTGRSVLLTLGSAHGERVARYRQSRDRDVFTFREFDRVVATLTLSESGRVEAEDALDALEALYSYVPYTVRGDGKLRRRETRDLLRQHGRDAR